MGTRHLVMVISKGKTKVAQYGQFDGYLDETGVGVLEFLIKNNDENFIQKIDNCEFISSKEVDKKYIELNPQFYRKIKKENLHF
jgi:hypothetical protein